RYEPCPVLAAQRAADQVALGPAREQMDVAVPRAAGGDRPLHRDGDPRSFDARGGHAKRSDLAESLRLTLQDQEVPAGAAQEDADAVVARGGGSGAEAVVGD